MEDTEIIKMFNDRNELAVKELTDKYGAVCGAVANNILHNPEDAKECLNDALMRVWETIPPKNPKYLCGYLTAITRNFAINKYRHDHREKRGKGEVLQLFEEFDTYVVTKNPVESEAEKKEAAKTINKFLEKTSANARKMFVKRYFLCEKVEDIAREMDTTENTVYVSLSRTRSRLKKYLEKKGYGIE